MSSLASGPTLAPATSHLREFKHQPLDSSLIKSPVDHWCILAKCSSLRTASTVTVINGTIYLDTVKGTMDNLLWRKLHFLQVNYHLKSFSLLNLAKFANNSHLMIQVWSLPPVELSVADEIFILTFNSSVKHLSVGNYFHLIIHLLPELNFSSEKITSIITSSVNCIFRSN